MICFYLQMLIWNALVLTQKNTKLTQSINRSPLGQKIPDLLLEQLKATKPETKTSQCGRWWSWTCPWWFHDHSRRALCQGRDSWPGWTFLTWIYLWKILYLFSTLSKGPLCVPCRTHGYYCLDSPSRLSRPSGLLDFLYCIPMPYKCFISSNLNSLSPVYCDWLWN